MASKITQKTLLSNLFLSKCLRSKLHNFKFSMSTAQALKDEPKGPNQESTRNKEEIKKFTEFSNSWWDVNGPMRPLHLMNSIRVPFIRDGIIECPPTNKTPLPLKDKKILDVGCGGGILSEALSKVGAEVTGIDANKDLIEVAKFHCENNTKLIKKPNYFCTTVEEHSEKHQDYYDAVVASEVIEHVNNKELFVKKCISTVKPGGKLFFTTPNRTRVSQFFTIFVAEYVLRLLPQGTHQYEMFVTPTELTFLLEKNNCHVEAVYGLLFNALTGKWDIISSQALLFALQAKRLESKK